MRMTFPPASAPPLTSKRPSPLHSPSTSSPLSIASWRLARKIETLNSRQPLLCVVLEDAVDQLIAEVS